MAKDRKFNCTIATLSINNFKYNFVLVAIFLDKQRPDSQKTQHIKDIVRKLLFNDYFLGLKYWGNAERMYEECCVGFRSKNLFLPEKIEFESYAKEFLYQNFVCQMVEPMFKSGFWPFYLVSSGGWWLYRLMYPHRFSGSKRKYLNWLLVLNMLGFVKFWLFSL